MGNLLTTCEELQPYRLSVQTISKINRSEALNHSELSYMAAVNLKILNCVLIQNHCFIKPLSLSPSYRPKYGTDIEIYVYLLG